MPDKVEYDVCNGRFKRISGSPRGDPTMDGSVANPYDTFICNKCGWSFEHRMYGNFSQFERNSEDVVADRMASHNCQDDLKYLELRKKVTELSNKIDKLIPKDEPQYCRWLLDDIVNNKIGLKDLPTEETKKYLEDFFVEWKKQNIGNERTKQ